MWSRLENCAAPAPGNKFSPAPAPAPGHIFKRLRLRLQVIFLSGSGYRPHILRLRLQGKINANFLIDPPLFSIRIPSFCSQIKYRNKNRALIQDIHICQLFILRSTYYYTMNGICLAGAGAATFFCGSGSSQIFFAAPAPAKMLRLQ